MSRNIVVTSGKGGVGKTTCVINIGICLAKQGFKVCLIDADLGLRNLDIILGIEDRIEFDILDIIAGKCELEKAIVKDKRNSNLHILPACKSLNTQGLEANHLQKVINSISHKYDFIFIDCPAGIEKGFLNAISCANEAIVIVTLDTSSIRDADKVIAILNNHAIYNIKIIINKLSSEDLKSESSISIKSVIDTLANDLIGIVYEDANIRKHNNYGTPSSFEKLSLTSRCFYNISKRLQGVEIELEKPPHKNIFMRLFSYIHN